VQSAQSAYDSAKKYYDAQKALFDLGGISASQLDTAQSQLATAQANLESAKISLSQNGKADDQTIAQLKLSVTTAQNQVDQARLNLRNAAIRAPFAGQLAAINLQPGMYASLNTAAFTLVSAERQISFNVAPGDAALLKSGSPILFTYQGSAYPARVSQSPSAPISGVVPMFATSGAGALSLAYGSVGTVGYSIPLATGALVPLSALQTLENQNYVFVIEKNKVSVRNVTVIAEAGTTAAVDGVSAGDVIVMSPPPGLIRGSQVQPTMVDSKQAGAL
jgi:multidrug efflux pump subunit AcrA (membrane-fusion protein)